MGELVLVRGARQLLTLHGPKGARRGIALRDLGLIPDGALLIRDGLVAEAGPSRRIENLALARKAREIDASGKVVMPGFVDGSTQLIFGAAYLKQFEALSESGGRAAVTLHDVAADSAIKAVRVTAGRTLEARANTYVRGLVRHGTTSLEIKTGLGLDETGEVKMLRVAAALNGKPLDVVPTYSGAQAVPSEHASHPDQYLNWICEHLLPKLRRRKMAKFVEIRRGGEAFNGEQIRRFARVAKGLGFPLKLQAEGEAFGLAAELGAVSVNQVQWDGSEDISVLARCPAICMLLPGPTFYCGLHGYAPARALIEAGVALALGTGFDPSSCPTFSMFMILALACRELHMTPAEAIVAATINGAHANGSADRFGSLEPGKQADFLVLNAADFRELPYHFGVNPVHMTVKRGVTIYQEGTLAV